jgi:signal transduction histidine kinase
MPIPPKVDPLERAYEFIGQAAHDLRNPAAVITGAASLLQQRWNALTDDLRREQLDAIAQQADRLRTLTDSLLDWAAIEAGKIPVHLERVDVRALCEQIGGGQVQVRVPGVGVLADPTHLGRVLANLLGNARKYGAPPFHIDGDAAPSEVVIRVADHGPGVPREIEDTLFEPFVRAGPAGEGSGLGLAIVRALVEVQGGRVWYERLDDGSCFSVALPVAS